MNKKIWIGPALFCGLLLYQFLQFDVTQDDAFISFRYVKNFLDGHGLVFNVGERVEGYTNFFWIILLSLLTKLGLPLIETARVLGIVAGIGTIALSAYAAHKLYPKRNWLWVLSVPLLLAANGAFAYWAGSGLETGLFTLLATASAITYLTNTPLSLLLVTLAALTRPEGALLAFLFGVAGIVLKQKSWKATLTYWGVLAALMVPYAVFKWFYFGSLLPNPFYAKTGFSAEYWKSGVEYTFLFLRHYALYGTVLILPLLFWKKLTIFSRFSLLVFLGYALYVVSVGGDVLKAHRFFVPALVFLCLPGLDALYLTSKTIQVPKGVFALAVMILGIYSYLVPLSYLKSAANIERGFISTNMINSALFFVEQGTASSFALSTIGAFSYYVRPKRVIDMLGLTEPVVAMKPEKVKGLESSWKERHFNAGHVLSRKPDVILFSTGYKPSAPAERVLFLYPDFRQNYRLEFFFREGRFNNYYRRFRDLRVDTLPDQSPSFVNLFNEGINLIENDNEKAVSRLKEALAKGPRDCSVLFVMTGYAYDLMGMPESTEFYLRKGLELDRGGSVSRYYYSEYLYNQGRYEEAAVQDSLLARMVPNYPDILKTYRNPR